MNLTYQEAQRDLQDIARINARHIETARAMQQEWCRTHGTHIDSLAHKDEKNYYPKRCRTRPADLAESLTAAILNAALEATDRLT